MPPQRRSHASAPPPNPEKKPRQSKIAKENNISAATEAEILEAFSLFSTPSLSEKRGVLPSPSLRRALTALGVPPSSASELQDLLETVDPTSTGEINYEYFVAVAAIKLANRSEQSQMQEVEDAFRLFTGGSGEARITVAALRRVARELREDVGEQMLMDMVLEANGGAGVGKGVGLQEFQGVMTRAGVFR